MNPKSAPLLLALVTTAPALAEEPVVSSRSAETATTEDVFQYGGPLAPISDEILRQTVFIISDRGQCDLSFLRAKDSAESGSYIRPAMEGKWCADWPHTFLGRTDDGRVAFQELSKSGELSGPQSCYITTIYNETHPDALMFDPKRMSFSTVRTVSLPSPDFNKGALTQMIFCSDLEPLLKPAEGPAPEQVDVSETHEPSGLTVSVRLSYVPTWSGVFDGSWQYREGLVEGAPAFPPARFQLQTGVKPLPWLEMGLEGGGAFAGSGSGLTHVGAFADVDSKLFEVGLAGSPFNSHWEPSEPHAEALQGTPYAALVLRRGFSVSEHFACGGGFGAEQIFPQGFDVQPGMTSLFVDLGCGYETHVPLSQRKKTTPAAPTPPVNAQAPEVSETPEAPEAPEVARTSEQAWVEYLQADENGNAMLALELLYEAKQLGSQEEKLNAEIQRLERGFGRVTFKGESHITSITWIRYESYSSENQRYFTFVDNALKATGSFEGLLPVGRYALRFNGIFSSRDFEVRNRISADVVLE